MALSARLCRLPGPLPLQHSAEGEKDPECGVLVQFPLQSQQHPWGL